MRFISLPLLILTALLLGSQAFAARLAIVDLDSIQLYEGAGRNFEVLETLSKGTQLAASNQPVEGFYKVRTPSGKIGFVESDALTLQAPALEAGADEGTPVVGPSPATADTPLRERPGSRKYLRIKALGGYNFFSSGDVNTLFNAAVLRFGYNVGGEFNFVFTPLLSMVVRMERLSKSVIIVDQATTKTFDLALSSLPLMTGVDVTVWTSKSGKFTSHAALLGGLALQTNLSSTSLNDSAPNVTSLTAHAFTGIAKVDIHYSFLNNIFSVFSEAGYRYLKTIEVIPADSPSGSELFKNPQTLAYVPVTLDLSGPFIGMGVAFNF